MEQSRDVLVTLLRAGRQTGLIPMDHTFTISEVVDAAEQAGIISFPLVEDTFAPLQGFDCFVAEAQQTHQSINDFNLEDLLGNRASNEAIESHIEAQFIDPTALIFDAGEHSGIIHQAADPNAQDIFQAPCVGGVSVASGDIFGGQAFNQACIAPTASLYQGSGEYMDASLEHSSSSLPGTLVEHQLIMASKTPSLSTNSYWQQESHMEPYVRSNKGPVVITSAINFEAFCDENGYRRLLAMYPRGQLRGPEQCTALCYFQWSNARGFMVESLGYTGSLHLRRYKIQYDNGSGGVEDLLTILEHRLGWNITTFQSVTRFFEDCEQLAANYIWDPELNPVSTNYVQSGQFSPPALLYWN
ncbi:hypothetical protein F5876DRAFT_71936 [Lentinula aff. lateritia]|uniref:Uncharacterized protein n=1 Tax=Lentinula aff. lateritia TaxID=2804960 RepID=A0ACC1UEJ7_9AGAR|nr:hypothetical protein F5876DRAFT_71936 [Lentinula aff. lateritia]